MSIDVLITDRDLNVLGDPLDGWTRLDVTLRFNEPSSGTITLPADPDAVRHIAAGTRIVLIRDGQVLASGPIERPMAPYQRGLPSGEGGEGADDPEPGTLTLAWVDDLAHLSWRLVRPNPSAGVDQQTASHYELTDDAETVIRALVDLNLGPSALEERRVPGLILGDVAGVGSTVSVRSRFGTVLAEAQSMAIAGGGLGFRTRQVGSQIVFEVYQPVDRTRTARYSWDLGNLRSVTVEQAAPAITHAVVGGQGEEENREIIERADEAAAAAWWRIEGWVDSRHEDTTAGLQQSGDEALAEGGETVQIAAVTVDTPDLRFGRDVGLGDRATIAYRPGVDAAEIVRQATIQATPSSGEYVSLLIGSQEATQDPEWVVLARRIRRSLQRLETGTDVPAPPPP